MAKNIFRLSFVLPTQVRTIKETSYIILSLLNILMRYDNVFSKFKYSKLNFPSVNFDLAVMDFNEAVDKLSETILHTNRSDIKQYEKIENPTVDFSRDFGFSVLLEFKKDKRKHFCIMGNLSSGRFSSLAIESFPIEHSDYDFDWYFNILKLTNDFLNPKYSGVKIVLSSYLDAFISLKVKYPLSWITYFSHDSKIKIPSDFGFEVINEKNGQYVIATREDFTQNKEDYFSMENKLIEGMKKLKEYSVEYSEE